MWECGLLENRIYQDVLSRPGTIAVAGRRKRNTFAQSRQPFRDILWFCRIFLIVSVSVAIAITIAVSVAIAPGLIAVEMIHNDTQQSTAQCSQSLRGADDHTTAVFVRTHNQHNSIHQTADNRRITDCKNRRSVDDDLFVFCFCPGEQIGKSFRSQQFRWIDWTRPARNYIQSLDNGSAKILSIEASRDSVSRRIFDSPMSSLIANRVERPGRRISASISNVRFPD